MHTAHSRREARRVTIETRHQKLKRLEKEGNKIWQENLSWKSRESIPLEKPIFIGYRKFHVIREDIAKSPYAKDAALALPYLSHTILCRRKDFKRKNKKTKQMEEIPHNLLGISDYLWERDELAKVWPASLRKHFKRKSSIIYGKPVYTWVFDKPWWFEEKQARHYATHVSGRNGAAESAYERIQNKLRNENWFVKEYGHGYDRDWDERAHRFWQDPDRADHWDAYLDNLAAE